MWPPSSNCLCEELRSNCDREHSKVIELEAEILKKQQMLNESEKRCAFIEKNHVNLQVKFQKYKECPQNQRVCDNSNSTASNAIFEINKLKDQLQGKDDTIRNLQTQINITRMLNVGSTVGSFDKQALETELTQLKDAITSVRIQNDGFKVENENVKRRYKELSETNTHSRDELTGKINALTAENAKLKTELSGKKSSGSTAFEKPKVLASGMYTNSSKYVPPPKRANWVKPHPRLPKKKQVTFQEPPRTSNRPIQKPPVQQNKKPNVPVNLSTRTKPATESHKPMPKSHTRNHRILPSKSVNARRATDHNRELNVVDHNQFMIRSLKSVNTKTPQAKHSVNHTKKINPVENATQTPPKETQLGDHWKGLLVVFKPQWKPTGATIRLYDNCPLTRIMEPIVEDLSENLPRASSTRTASIRKSDTSVLEDLKALSWKTCQEGSLLNLSDHRIVDWKIHKEGKKSYYQIIRVDGKSQMYMIFSHMLKSFNKEDLETLYKLVKAKYKSTRPVEDLDLELWNDLKTMFEPHVEDRVWRNQQKYKVLSWKLYDSCGVHFMRMQHVQVYMLVEKRYPLTPPTITNIMNMKLQKLDDFGDKYQVYGRIVGIKSLLNASSITAAHIRVNAAQLC
ncbi:hypothetical protein Tco_0409443 [Tanacetum coccineum]